LISFRYVDPKFHMDESKWNDELRSLYSTSYFVSIPENPHSATIYGDMQRPNCKTKSTEELGSASARSFRSVTLIGARLG
jgi:hypothetical protein